ncbi:MAG: P1 family peptidase [Anaerolinea sp.]|nr:P1 family peptidase [Anaerolinea sp.]
MTTTPTNNTLTAVPGILVGHATDLDGVTGCTAIICPPETVGGVDVRGGAPGTREVELLRPMYQVNQVNAIMLAGGSAYGLAAADGAMRYLEEHGLGYNTRAGFTVPIVSSAIVFDLAIGSQNVRPDSAMGYAACAAATDAPVEQGSVGVGTGCRVCAMMGNDYATKGGVGSAAVDLGGGLIVAALCAVNAVGEVVDEQGEILAGLRDGSGGYLPILDVFRNLPPPPVAAATVIGVVATNARLSKEAANKVAQMAHDGLARAVRPAHTMFDGDTFFALATGAIPADVNLVGAFGAEMVTQAIRNAVRAARSLGGVKSCCED